MSRHRLETVRPRYGRIGAAAASLVVTVVAVAGALGVLPAEQPTDAAADRRPVADAQGEAPDVLLRPATRLDDAGPRRQEPPMPATRSRPADTLPPNSGEGRRVVFSESQQRVWLVGQGGVVRRTYLVSGSLEDNLDPGTYAVFSRSEWAVGIDDSGVMRWFVRFTRGENAAIGFHSIPTKNGEPLQTVGQLGTPQSHGCIRQRDADAQALWAFAPIGTKVVVVA